MSLHPGLILGALGLGLAALLASEEEQQQKAPKPEPRPGQPTPGGKAPIPGIPSIPAPPNAEREPAVPPAILARMVAAIATGSSREMRRVAAQLEKEGYPRQASELRAAADALDASADAVGVPILNPTPAPKPRKPKGGPPPFVPPEISAPPEPPGLVTINPITVGKPTVPVIRVPAPPPGAVPVPPPPAAPVAPPYPRGAIPDAATLVGKTALMLWESAPGPVRDPALLAEYKRQAGFKKDLEIYGPGTAKSLMSREIVPPVPFEWTPGKQRSQAKDLANNYKYKASKDRARREEWLQAAEALKPFTG